MTSQRTFSLRKYYMLPMMAAVVVSLALTAASASAYYETFEHVKLGSKQWTCNRCQVGAVEDIYAEETEVLPATICVGPAQYSGGKWVFPYSWLCKYDVASWEFTPIEAAAAVDNPSASTYHFSGLAS